LTIQKLRHYPGINSIPNIWLGEQITISFVFWVSIKPSEIVIQANPYGIQGIKNEEIVKDSILTD